MKNIRLKILLTVIVIFQIGVVGVMTAYAQQKEPDFYLQIPIGNLTTITADEFKSGRSIPTYIITLYRWLVGFVLILGVIALMFGGMIWILAGGGDKRITQAKGIIKNSFIGILIALGSYLFLWTISPNLVQFRPLILPRVKEITLALVGKNITPGAEGKVAEFNAMSCPSASETEFDAYFTAYYTPPYGEKGNYEDFWCNAAMQCWCPNNNNRDQTRICKNSGGYEWHPCAEFSRSTPYCTSTSGGTPPQANYSLAADQTCFKVGCKLEVNGKIYEVQDKGDLIKGRHFDLYAGDNLKNADFSGDKKVKMVDPATCLR